MTKNLPETARKSQHEAMVPAGVNMFFNVQRFEFAQRVAGIFAASTMVPDHFKGNVGNCMIALNLAERFGADPFMVMQNMYVVGGRPGLEGKLVIALINQSGKFTPLQFKLEGAGKDKKCSAYATHKETGESIEATITWAMVEAEGWNKDKQGKNGYVQKSKWNTIPDQMFRYRSATFFARTYCPEVLLGMQTVEELHDFIDLEPAPGGSYEVADKTKDKIVSLKEKLKVNEPSQPEAPVSPPGESGIDGAGANQESVSPSSTDSAPAANGGDELLSPSGAGFDDWKREMLSMAQGVQKTGQFNTWWLKSYRQIKADCPEGYKDLLELKKSLTDELQAKEKVQA